MSYSIGGNTFTVQKGLRLNGILQKLMVFLEAPTCADGVALDLQLKDIKTTSATIRFVGTTGTAYRITWDDGVTPVTEDVLDINSFIMLNLAADTQYTVKITTLPAATCDSVTLTFKTKAA